MGHSRVSSKDIEGKPIIFSGIWEYHGISHGTVIGKSHHVFLFQSLAYLETTIVILFDQAPEVFREVSCETEMNDRGELVEFQPEQAYEMDALG